MPAVPKTLLLKLYLTAVNLRVANGVLTEYSAVNNVKYNTFNQVYIKMKRF